MRLRLGLWLLVCLLPWSVNAAPPIDLETALKSIPPVRSNLLTAIFIRPVRLMASSTCRI